MERQRQQCGAKPGALEAAVYGTPVRWSSSTLVVGASAGVVLLGALDTPADVIARADTAMYARKDERKGISSLRGEKEQVTQ